mmetsp:Transcript_15544/g.38510  ORF Transcript_15544/g.38510 Transcript_15544/m.38510 type:complete len:229 (-) Transcript_15544:1424-2110(-)
MLQNRDQRTLREVLVQPQQLDKLRVLVADFPHVEEGRGRIFYEVLHLLEGLEHAIPSLVLDHAQARVARAEDREGLCAGAGGRGFGRLRLPALDVVQPLHAVALEVQRKLQEVRCVVRAQIHRVVRDDQRRDERVVAGGGGRLVCCLRVEEGGHGAMDLGDQRRDLERYLLQRRLLCGSSSCETALDRGLEVVVNLLRQRGTKLRFLEQVPKLQFSGGQVEVEGGGRH